MKVYDKDTGDFKDFVNPFQDVEDIMRKLDKDKVPYVYSQGVLTIEDDDEVKALAAISK